MSCTDESPAHRMRWPAARLVVALVLTLGACSTTPPPAPAPTRTAAPAAPKPSAGALPAPETPRTLAGLRLQAARRLVTANPGLTYTGEVPEPLLAIPVLEVELNADGSVRRIEVLREPRQAKDTIQLAIDAVRRAAPFGDVSRLPRPWKFTETFLFRDDRKFKPRTLDS
ncbi:MAG: hypothetical protein Q8L12_02680 [Methylibium sp.]|nr:hypothetical protein [Methylibium sp.]